MTEKPKSKPRPRNHQLESACGKLLTIYGKPTKCENKRCMGISTSYLYSIKPGAELTPDIKNFDQLCRSCMNFTKSKRRTLVSISPTGRKIEVYDPFGEHLGTYATAVEVGKMLDIDSNKILDVCRGKRDNLNGFTMKFKKDDDE